MPDADRPRSAAPVLPCIRCGDCASACPVQLQPYRLFQHARADRLDQARRDGVFDCSECGACDRVCPSRIPLLDHFLWLKSELRAGDDERSRAAAARDRYEARRIRLETEDAERAAQAVVRREQASSSNAVQAALERARARKRGKDAET